MNRYFAAVILEIDRLLEDFPELADDDQLRLDAIEGETEALEVAARLYRSLAIAQAMQHGLKTEIKRMRYRKERYAVREEKTRDLLMLLMQAMDTRKLELPAATLSIGPSRPKVVVVDEDQLPEEFVRIKREADKTAIGNALKAGQTVPGAALSNGGETLTIRRT